jgi:hypothetical protein
MHLYSNKTLNAYVNRSTARVTILHTVRASKHKAYILLHFLPRHMDFDASGTWRSINLTINN